LTTYPPRTAIRLPSPSLHAGVMMRKALGTTVQAQVAEELNKLINGQYR
jgi:hypothetical protein